MSDVEKYNAKDEFLKAFEEMRPDFFIPEMYENKKDQEHVAAMLRPAQTRTAMFASIPMRCRGAKCAFADVCPLQLENKAPVGKKCHPSGTKIMTKHHGEVNIEDLDPLVHLLWGWEKKYKAIRKGKGFGFSVHERDYDGLMVELVAGDYSHQVTQDHICPVRFSKRASSAFCVYLMRKGDLWRVGSTKLMHEYGLKNGLKSLFGPGMRASGEQADSVWVLGVYESKTEALLAEERFSVEWQIPRALFIQSSTGRGSAKWDGLYKWVTQEQLTDHHKFLMKDSTHYEHLLSHLGLSIHHPIWTRDRDAELGKSFFSMSHAMYIRACNFISGYMEVPVIPEEPVYSGARNYQVTEWRLAWSTKDWYSGPVYSMDVQVHKTYFANKIATHNCPFEMAMVADFMHSLMDELHVRPDNLIEVAMVRDLVNQEVQQIRVSNRLSLDDFIQENVVGIDPEGNPVLKKELHQAVELEDRILKRKKELRNQLMATREKKAQIGERSKDDSNVISNLLEQIREVDILNQTKLQKELGTYGLDDYIESHVVEEKTAIEEGD